MLNKTIFDDLKSDEDIMCEGHLWRNIPGSNQRPMCKCGSRKEHWKKYNQKGRKWPETCQVCSCHKQAEYGALIVGTLDDESNEEYIVPMCQKHSDDTKKFTFDLKTSAVLAPAEVKE